MAVRTSKVVIPIALYATVLIVLLLPIPFISDYVYVLLLFLPILDPHWELPKLQLKSKYLIVILICIASISIILTFNYDYIEYFITMLLLTALPEEWFFRAYLLSRAGFDLRGNIIVSIAFSILHGINQSAYMLLLVFVPSLLFGWVYQQTRNIYLTVILHALSNLIFIVYIKETLNKMVKIV